MRHDFPLPRFEGLLHRIYAALVFRRKMAALGKGAFVSPYATLDGMQAISIGADAAISRRCFLTIVEAPASTEPSRITIGDRTYLGRGCTLSACGSIAIGSNVTFGDNVYLSAGQHGYADPGTRVLDQPMSPGQVIVGNGAWIGYGAFISTTSSLTIGEGAIIAANAVVTQDVAPYTMVGGVPARELRRFDHQSRQWQRAEATLPKA